MKDPVVPTETFKI